MANKNNNNGKGKSAKAAPKQARKEKYDLSKPPTMSDEFLMGSAPTLSSLRIAEPTNEDSGLD